MYLKPCALRADRVFPEFGLAFWTSEPVQAEGVSVFERLVSEEAGQQQAQRNREEV